MNINHHFEIVLDPDVLREEYVPDTIRAREPHIKELQRCISPALKGQKPLTAWLHGSPGTGKTTVASHILSELKKRTSVSGLYVNCWKHNTFYSVLEHMLTEMRRGFGDARDTRVRLGQFERLVKHQPFLVVLDEIDLMDSRERDHMIYNLFSVGNVGLICISESRYPILTLEPRIRSRLNPQLLAFEPYSESELVEILKERAAKALHPDSWSLGMLKLIAEKAQGDTRIAIQTLKNAALCADAQDKNRIEPAHIDKGYADTGALRRTYEIKRLTEHHRLLYRIVKDRPGITSPELFGAYLSECHSRNWRPIASRTFSLYTKKMAELRIFRVKRARVKGRVHAFSAS